MALRSINGLALCAGVGGLELGLHLALGDEYRTACYVEREAHAAAVLVARMGEGVMDPAPVWDDLAAFDGRRWRGCADLVSGGYPCQPFSFAGKRAGVDDERHLWPHFARIIDECGAGVAFLENVPGHLSLGFDEVCADLHRMGFRVAAGVFSAAEVGAPHRRERLFALAVRDSAERRGRDGEPGHLAAEERGEVGNAERPRRPEAGRRLDLDAGREPQARRGSVVDADSRRAGCDREESRDGDQSDHRGLGRELDDALLVRPQGQRGHERDGNEPGRLDEGATRPTWPPGPRGDWSGIERGLWPATTQSRVRGVADGLAERVDRLRACGNGVVPLVAAHAFRTLAAEVMADMEVIR